MVKRAFRRKLLQCLQRVSMLGLIFFCVDGHPKIQIAALKDGRGVIRATGTAPFLTDSFCVISTIGGVKLTFKNSGGVEPATRSWRAINAAGESVRYQQYVALAGDPIPTAVSDPSTASIIVTASKAATSAAACGTGNVFKGVVALDPISNRSPFIDTVSIVVTPL